MRRQLSRVAGEVALARSQNKVIKQAIAKGLKRGTVEWNQFVYSTDFNPFERQAELRKQAEEAK